MRKPSTLASRFEDTGQRVYEIMDEILVVCPRCKSCARVTTNKPGDRNWFAPRRLTCRQCGYAKEWAEREIHRGWFASPAVDDFFGAVLWLQEPCEGHILWAYNIHHLNLIEGYVGAKLRERRWQPTIGWANSSLLNRLPRWVTSAKNRPRVLKALRKLRAKLAQ